jgi:hypothetical protein
MTLPRYKYPMTLKMQYSGTAALFLALAQYLHGCRSLAEDEEWQVDQVIWTLLFSLILVIAMLGNSIVIWIILGEQLYLAHTSGGDRNSLLKGVSHEIFWSFFDM